MSLEIWSAGGQPTSALGVWKMLGSFSYYPVPEITIETIKTTYNAGEEIILNAVVRNSDPDISYSYLWSTGETTDQIKVIAPVLSTNSTITKSVAVSNGETETEVSLTINIEASDIDYLINKGIKEKIYRNVEYVFSESIVTGVDEQGNNILKLLEDYDGVEYYIATTGGSRVLTLKKDNGITIENDKFIVYVPNSELNFTGVFNQYLVASEGSRRELITSGRLIIQGDY
jgi:hypothetical protein